MADEIPGPVISENAQCSRWRTLQPPPAFEMATPPWVHASVPARSVRRSPFGRTGCTICLPCPCSSTSRASVVATAPPAVAGGELLPPASAQKRLARPVEAEESPQRLIAHPDHRLAPPRQLPGACRALHSPSPAVFAVNPRFFQRRALHGADSPRFRRPRVPARGAATSPAAAISPKRVAAPKNPPRSVRPIRCMIRFRAL